MKIVKNKLTSSLFAFVVLASSSFSFVTTDAATQTSKLSVARIDRVSTGALQTVQVRLLDQSGLTIADGTDQVALKMGTHTGLVRVYDQDGEQVLADDDTGQFVVSAVDGIATFQVSDTSQEAISYRLTDVTDNAVPSVSATGYFATVRSYKFTGGKIADTGELHGNDVKSVVVSAFDSNGSGVAYAPVYLSFAQAVGGANASVGGQALTSKPQKFMADRNGQVIVDYQMPAIVPNGGTDRIVAQNTSTSTSISANASYTFQTISKFTTNSTIAGSGSLGVSQKVDFTMTAKDSSGIPIANTTVYLSMTQAAGGGTAAVGNAPINSVVQPFTTDSNGAIVVSYTAPASLPNGGTDSITVQEKVTGSKIKATSGYTFAKASHYVMVPNVIATSGTLKANQVKTYAMTVTDAANKPMPGARVFLSLTQAAGSDSTAKANGVDLTSTPQAINADQFGQVSLEYTAPSVMPNSGTDKIVAQDAATNARLTGSSSYTFAAISKYVMFPAALATTGSLKAGDTKVVTMTTEDRTGKAIPNARVYLSLTHSIGEGGSATVGLTDLTDTPTAFVSDNNGQIVVTYTAPQELPGFGVDTIKAQDTATNPHISGSSTYTFNSVSKFDVSPVTIADKGSLEPNESTQFAFTAKDASGHYLPKTVVYLSRSQLAAGGGVASVKGTVLTAQPQRFVTNTDGQIIVTYTTPATLPSGGTDAVTIQNTLLNARVKATASYSYNQIASFVATSSTFASTGTLAAGDSKTITVTAVDSHQNAIGNTNVYLAFTKASGGGTITVNGK
ncbi:MAG: hypothetical protein ACXVP2_11905, partial [Tumebacillaceae bacterium]